MSADEPYIGQITHPRGMAVTIVHLGRNVEVAFSPKGKSVRVWVDEEELGASKVLVAEKEEPNRRKA